MPAGARGTAWRHRRRRRRVCTHHATGRRWHVVAREVDPEVKRGLRALRGGSREVRQRDRRVHADALALRQMALHKSATRTPLRGRSALRPSAFPQSAAMVSPPRYAGSADATSMSVTARLAPLGPVFLTQNERVADDPGTRSTPSKRLTREGSAVRDAVARDRDGRVGSRSGQGRRDRDHDANHRCCGERRDGARSLSHERSH